MGIAFLIIVCILAQILKPPPAGYIPPGTAPKPASDQLQKKEEYLPREMLKTWQFYALWFMYACGAGAGLMVISVAKKIVASQVAEAMAVAAVVGLAVGNGSIRIIAGMLSDKLGRKITLFMFFIAQAVLLLLLSKAQGESILASSAALIIITALIGGNYGSNLALFPSISKDFYGLKNFGMNYGLIFTAWGVGGFMLAKLAGQMYDKYNSFNFAYFCASSLLIIAAIMVFLLRPPHHIVETAEE